MEVTITRGEFTDKYTRGIVECPGFKALTIERPDISKSPNNPHPCVKNGTYNCKLVMSPRFYASKSDFGFGRGMVFEITGVAGRNHILIHPANCASQLEGCVSFGTGWSPAVEIKTGKEPGVTSSVAAIKAFMAVTKGQPFVLVIK